jgi:hypothetical protein
MSDLIRPIDFGSVFPWIGMSPASKGFREQKDAAGPIPNIFAVLSGVGSLLHGNWLSRLAKKLIGFLIHANDRKIRIIGLLIYFQHILHASDECCVLVGRDDPACTQMRFQFVFFNVL